MHVYSYEVRPRPEEGKPSLCSDPNPKFRIIRERPDSGYWVGSTLLGGLGEGDWTTNLDDLLEIPRQGDVDITLHVVSHSPIERDIMFAVADPFSRAVAVSLNMAHGDMLLPVAPLQVLKLGPTGSSWVAWTFGVEVRHRSFLTQEELVSSLKNHMDGRAALPAETARALDVAMRRYLASFEEEDAVDEYCDLWEACEFATYGLKAKGGKVGRIAHALASQMNKAGLVDSRSKAFVENVLDIRGLYDIRGSVVHEALDNPSALKEKSKFIKKIVEEIFRNRLGINYAADPAIESLFAANQ